METVYIPVESDFKRWVKEAVQEYYQNAVPKNAVKKDTANDLIGRKEVAKLLQVSLVTLTDWMKRGLPYHKQRGRVYFIKTEVLEYIMENNPSKTKVLARYAKD
mgnify:CR=1 FL=1